ncbi:MAG: hypothetical protein QW666_03135 [Candidatus Woesearchaeota archaeon]
MLKVVHSEKNIYEFADGPERIIIKLNPEQEKLLNARPGPEYSLDSIGFFHPDQVLSYSCAKCNRAYEERQA